MPRWRRRRFQRLRRNRKDDHTWVFKKIQETNRQKIDLPSINGNPGYLIKLKVDWTFVENFGTGPGETAQRVKNRRQCTVCGQDSISGQPPKYSCKEAITRKVMES
jgi:hypothetical protein